MPDESCRACGGELVKYSLCAECRKAIQKICKICSLKTHEHLHLPCLQLESYQIINERNVSMIMKNYTNPEKANTRYKNHKDKNHLGPALIILGIIGIFITVSGMNYFDLFHIQGDNTQISESSYSSQSQSPTVQKTQPDSIQKTNILSVINDKKATYDNCIGFSNGVSFTITCPTEEGIVYKTIVEIPSELISKFQNNIFNLRNFSITEHLNSILIEFEKKTYVTDRIN
jgi:hypothetical protein